jgi:hypothetical protein
MGHSGSQKAEVDATNKASIMTRLPCRGDLVASQTVKMIFVSVNRRGRSSASLPDETLLVASSRQPFFDADAVNDELKRPNAHRRKARFEGRFAIGWAERADRPFESCNFAHVVAIAGTNVVAP